MRRCLLILAFLPATWVCAHAADVITCDFSGPIRSPWLSLVGDAKIEGGVLATAAQDNWQRSGLNVGPLPLTGATYDIQYDFRPVVFGDQCQEFVSQSPSTHWYMCYVQPQGHMQLHTRDADGWQLRKRSEEGLEVGRWYHVWVRLSAKTVQMGVKERDGRSLWDTGVVSMNDLGKETTFALIDEASKAGGKTEWANLRVGSDDPNLVRKMKATMAALEKRRQEQERRRAAAQKLRDRGIALIPMPQEVELLGSRDAFALKPGLQVGGAPADCRAVVARVIKERLGIAATTGEGGSAVRLRPLAVDSPLRKRSKQAYTLRADRSGVVIEAAAAEGFFYGAQTLCQLAAGDKVCPAARITDWPAIENRLAMVAVSQGAFQVIDVEYWKRMIRELAAVKMNIIMPYFEGGTMYYEKYPFLGLKGRDGFTIEKGRVLSDYGREHFVELVPQQNSLGHAGNILLHEELKDIREGGDTFCATNPKTFAFLDDLYAELCQAFPYARWIHVGGDEFAQGFALCPSCKKRAEEIGKPGLYAEYMMKVRELLRKRDRGMMIWWHEEGYTDQAADKLAKDIAVFDWHYGDQASYPTLAKLQSEGFTETWATPAVTRYYGSANDWDETFGNISGFMAAGAEQKVPGECTCTWVHGVWGGRNMFELNLYGLVFSAACAWNPMASDYEGFRADFGREWFGLRGGDVGKMILQAIHAPFGMGREQKFWSKNAAAEEMLAPPLSATAEEIGKRPEIVAEARELLAFCGQASAALASIEEHGTRNKVSAEYFAHDVHIHETVARRIIAVKGLMDAYEAARKLKGKEREDLLGEQIAALRGLVGEYAKIEAMFERSIHEAGGGKCGWGGWWPFVAGGGIMFRAPQGRAEVEKEIEYLTRAVAMDEMPEKAFPG
jgi:hypothetical protein